jgi:large subunit ribosomal protein L24
MRIKKNDYVVVVAGNAKGEKGHIKTVLTEKNSVIISGVNMRKKHVKPSQENPQGGRIEEEGPIAISNVMPYSEKAEKPSRVRIEKTDDGKKQRFLKACGSEYGERY